MSNRFNQVFSAGKVAVITGGAGGIGRALALACAAKGMRVCIADNNEERIAVTSAELVEACAQGDSDVLALRTNVAEFSEVEALHEQVYQRFGRVDLLVNNAGVLRFSDAWSHLDNWKTLMDVNVFGVIHGVQAFTESMLAQEAPAMIVNLGSKQGITSPPGAPGYNVTKAAVKALTESLQHSLRNQEGGQVSAHLLVPGFVYSDMVKPLLPHKPDFAWTPEQTVEYFLERLAEDDFYILCPDGETSLEMDQRRILWGAGDLAENRPALSRWHPDYADEFAKHMSRESDE